MDSTAMRLRCPASRPRGRAWLLGYEFFVCADGYASIRRKARAVVHGVGWTLAAHDEAALDRYESVGSGLYLRALLPVRLAGRVRVALVYIARTSRPGPPVTGYMEDVVAAAVRWDLPAAYLSSLRSWLPAPAGTCEEH